MKKTAIALGLLVSSVALASVTKGQKAPDFTLPTLSGSSKSLASLKGKVVFIDFWAQGCEPCKKELPELEKLSKEYAGKNVAFLGVNIDKQKENADRLARQLGITFDVLLDPSGGVAGTYDLPKMPTSFVVDKKGIVRAVNAGFDGPSDVAKFKSEIEDALKK